MAGAAALVGSAAAVGALINSSAVLLYAGAAPLFGRWFPHVGPGTPAAVVVALLVVVWGPSLARRLSWRWALVSAYVAAVAWILALALVDGWNEGFAGRLTTEDEYLHEVPGITDVPAMLSGFAERIPDGRPDSWTTHVSGHPPGATLVFVALHRIGLGGGGWAALVCVLAGAVVAVAVPVTLRALGNADAAREVLPFAVLLPGAVWVGVSADGLFAGVSAAGIALLALACRADGWRSAALGLLAGLVLGGALFLSYGLVLLAPMALAVVILTRRWQVLAWCALGTAVVVGLFALAGFWWFDGYELVRVRYYQGIASIRPYWYWIWANLACLVLAIGPATVAGLRRAAVSWRHPAVVLAGATVLAVLAADLSGMSKAEVERIWLPFAVWLVASTALLPKPRWWLAGQAITALLVNHLVLTGW